MDSVMVREAQKAASSLSALDRWRVRHGKKLCLGEEIPRGGTGHLPFYLFWCPKCGHYVKDHPHGFIQDQHLDCSICGARYNFVPGWVFLVEIYYSLKWHLVG